MPTPSAQSVDISKSDLESLGAQRFSRTHPLREPGFDSLGAHAQKKGDGMHVIAVLFRYTPCKIADDYAILVQPLVIEDHIENVPEFKSFGPLLAMPFGCFSTMIYSYDCYRYG